MVKLSDFLAGTILVIPEVIGCLCKLIETVFGLDCYIFVTPKVLVCQKH